MQYLSAGSYSLQHALGDLAECALKADEDRSPRLLRALQALVQHYQKFGKREASQALLEKYPEARRFVQEH